MLHDSIRYQDGLPVSTTPLALSHVLEIGQKWRGSDILSSAKGRFSLLLRFRLHSSRSGRFRENPLPCLKIVADYSGALYSLCEIFGNVSAYWEWNTPPANLRANNWRAKWTIWSRLPYKLRGGIFSVTWSVIQIHIRGFWWLKTTPARFSRNRVIKYFRHLLENYCSILGARRKLPFMESPGLFLFCPNWNSMVSG